MSQMCKKDLCKYRHRLYFWKKQMMSKIFRFLPFSRQTARAYRANVVQHFSSAFLRLIVKIKKKKTVRVLRVLRPFAAVNSSQQQGALPYNSFKVLFP